MDVIESPAAPAGEPSVGGPSGRRWHHGVRPAGWAMLAHVLLVLPLLSAPHAGPWLWVVIAALVGCAFRAFRAGVQVQGAALVSRGLLLTRRIPLGEVAAVQAPQGYPDVAHAVLADGSRVRLTSIGSAPVTGMDPTRLERVVAGLAADVAAATAGRDSG